MSDDLDLRGIDGRHEPEPQFRSALQRRLAAIVVGTDPGSVTGARDMATIDLEPTSASSAPKRHRRRVATAMLSAAAAVVAIVVVAIREDDATPADQPSPTVSVPLTTPPRPLPSAHPQLEPGTYYIDQVAGQPTPRILVTIGAGWEGLSAEEGWEIVNHGIGRLAVSRPDGVFSDACHPFDGFHPGPVDTVDGLVAALREQQGGWTDVTATSDLSIDGYAGKAFQRTAPTEFSGCETGFGGTRLSSGHVTHPLFGSWGSAGEGGEARPGAGTAYYEPGQTETLWVLDIEGTVVLINTGVWPGPSWAARADVAGAVLDSIRIERSSSPEAAANEADLSMPPMLPVGGREWGVGALAPDLGQVTDEAAVLDALVASGPLQNQLLTDPNLRPGVPICADIARYHEPSLGSLVHEATATLTGRGGVVLVFTRPSGSEEVRMYGTSEADPDTGGCPLLMKTPLHPGPAADPPLPD